MILVTLGTQDKSFERLLKRIDKEIKNHTIKDKVIVQAGYTKYPSKNMEIFDYKPKEELNELVKKCDLMITHAGVGSILNGITNNKKVIAVPRLKEYKEVNELNKILYKTVNDNIDESEYFKNKNYYDSLKD